MFYGLHDGWMWGLHWGGWIVWVFLIIGVVWAISRAQQASAPVSSQHRQTPLEILQRRYAAGDVSTGEFEERKALLERDQ